jgi:hypothetical protein
MVNGNRLRCKTCPMMCRLPFESRLSPFDVVLRHQAIGRDAIEAKPFRNFRIIFGIAEKAISRGKVQARTSRSKIFPFRTEIPVIIVINNFETFEISDEISELNSLTQT